MINAQHIAGLYLKKSQASSAEPQYSQEYVDTLWDSVRRVAMSVPPHVTDASNRLGGIVPGNTLTDNDYADLSTLRVWISGLPVRGRA